MTNSVASPRSSARCAIWLAVALIYSLPLFPFGVLIGYDTPPMYLGVALFVFTVFSRRHHSFPLEIFLCLILVAIGMLISGGLFTAPQPEKQLTQVSRFIIAMLTFIGTYGATYDVGPLSMYKWIRSLGCWLAALALVQFYMFNVNNNFALHFRPTNPTFIASGGAGAVAAEWSIFRATGTFPEPSWLGYFLVPPLVLSVESYLQRGGATLWELLLLALGVLTTVSVSAFGLGLAGVGLAFLISAGTRRGKLALVRIALLIAMTLVAIVASFRPLMIYLTARLAGLWLGADPSAVHRLNSIRQGLAMFISHPLLGVGIGQYRVAADHLGLGAMDVSIDSGWISIMCESGLLGLGTWLVLFGLLLRGALVAYWRQRQATPLVVVILCILLLSNFNWWYDQLIWLMLGTALAHARGITMKRCPPSAVAISAASSE